MSKITVTGQITLTGGQLTAKETYVAPAGPAGKSLWSWGDASFGQLALGNTVDKSSPVQVGDLTTWTNISSGIQHSHGIKTDGTLWGWGRNNYRPFVGDNTDIDRSSPVQIGALTDWANTGGGDYHTLAVKTDGTLWAWGRNAVKFTLGDGTAIDRSSPVQIGALTDWVRGSGGRTSSVAIKTDGTIWSWGGNTRGELGLNGGGDRSSPVQIGSLTDWASINAGFYHTIALKIDGTIWSWGENSDDGQLGLGDEIDRSSPVQIGLLTTWASINAGQYHTIAVKTNGTLWAWGKNAIGELGDGTIVNKSSPIQIGALTDWSSVIDAGRRQNVAIKTDGTLWAWGEGIQGQLGNGIAIHRSSPVQIGSDTNWLDISAGNRHSHALKTV